MTSFKTIDGVKVLAVAIRSIKRDREYLLNLFATHPEIHHMEHKGRIYNAGDIYAGRSSNQEETL